MADIRIFAHNGWIVHHPNPEADPEWDERGDLPNLSGFKGRRPFIIDEGKRHIFLGAPNWYHEDVVKHHHLDKDDPYAAWTMTKGYFGGGPEWGNGLLKWYPTIDEEDVPEYHPDVAQALIEAGHDIPNASGEDATHDDLDELDLEF